ncbi:MAG: hypothetical protein R3D02_11865 [Hyphomicrobiales bacterium]
MIADGSSRISGDAKERRWFFDVSGLVVDHTRDARAVALMRGLRDATDFDYEMNGQRRNGTMAPGVRTLFFPASPPVRHVLRRRSLISAMGGDVAQTKLPASVLPGATGAASADQEYLAAMVGVALTATVSLMDRDFYFTNAYSVHHFHTMFRRQPTRSLDPSNSDTVLFGFRNARHLRFRHFRLLRWRRHSGREARSGCAIFTDLKDSRVVIKLRNDVAPVTPNAWLSREGSADGLTFHHRRRSSPNRRSTSAPAPAARATIDHSRPNIPA